MDTRFQRTGGPAQSSRGSPRCLTQQVEGLYHRYHPRLLRRCLRITRDRALAEDALHSAFVKLMRHGGGLAQACSEIAFLNRVVDRCCYVSPPRAA
jgi:DNA-directed RNA polymerase specialized sigma24 family protein